MEISLRQVLNVCEATLPSGHRKIAMARAGLGVALLQQDCFDEAERHLLAAHAGLVDGPGVEPEWRQAIIRRLAELYERWNEVEPLAARAQQAAHWKARLDQPSGTPK